MYEVELKFPLSDPDRILAELESLGAQRLPAVEQRDAYFAHPVRDFGETDEALRIRCVGEHNVVTYKGPKIDPQTKTRQEIEIPFADGAATADQLAELLTRLGFRSVRTVAKRRTPFRLVWENRELDVAFDELAGLGAFLEIELLADENGRNAARDCILRLAERLQLRNSERRSYLCLLLETDGS